MDKASILAELARTVAAQASRDTLPHRLCFAVVTMIGAEGAALTIAYTEPHRVTLCTTNDRAARLEDLQDVLGQGPGPTAFRSGRPVLLELDDRPRAEADTWPSFEATVRASLGGLVILALPVHADGEVLGVLTCHFPPYTRPLLEPASSQFLADAVGVALATDPDRLAADLTGPWASRAQIHQATGMVVAQLHVHPDDAVALLRAHAFAHSWSLAEVAAAVLSRRLDFSEPDTTTDPRTGPTTGEIDTSDGTSAQ